MFGILPVSMVYSPLRTRYCSSLPFVVSWNLFPNSATMVVAALAIPTHSVLPTVLAPASSVAPSRFPNLQIFHSILATSGCTRLYRVGFGSLSPLPRAISTLRTSLYLLAPTTTPTPFPFVFLSTTPALLPSYLHCSTLRNSISPTSTPGSTPTFS
uniref:Protein gp48 n=1 Tax=Lygus hesperus TaxID=30085 RepID=A0A0A9WIU6_LYGHE